MKKLKEAGVEKVVPTKENVAEAQGEVVIESSLSEQEEGDVVEVNTDNPEEEQDVISVEIDESGELNYLVPEEASVLAGDVVIFRYHEASWLGSIRGDTDRWQYRLEGDSDFRDLTESFLEKVGLEGFPISDYEGGLEMLSESS